MTKDIYIGRQPIVDHKGELVAFELSFMDRVNGINGENLGTDSADLIVGAFAELGVDQVLGGRRGFLRVGPEMLVGDVLSSLPPEQVVLQFPSTVLSVPRIIERCAGLKREGFRLALTGLHDTPAFSAMPNLFEVVKIDMNALPPQEFKKLVGTLARLPATLVAEGVDEPELARTAEEVGCHLFQGYFFARPEVLSGKRAASSKLALLRLLSMVAGDVQVEQLQAEFNRDPGLTFNLLRMVNSAASGMRTSVGSVREALMILGRNQLRRWIQLLLYSASDKAGLLQALPQLAATRGRLMELLAGHERSGDREYAEHAFTTGILSLLDTLLGAPMAELVPQLNLPQDVAEALISKSGRLGRLLELIECKEKNSTEGVDAVLRDLGFLTLSELVRAELEAVHWASLLDQEAN